VSAENIIAEKYARAMLFLAQEEGRLEEVLGDLDLVEDLFGRGEGRELLVHPLLSPEQKQAAVKELVQGKITNLTFSLLRLLIEKHRGTLVPEIAAAYREGLQHLRGQRSATVTAAMPLTEEQLRHLRQTLTALAGAEVDLKQVLDPNLRGGARVTMGDLVLDGSLDARLRQLRKALQRSSSDAN